MSEVFKGASCEVEVICDSISQERIRLITVRLRYWRPIHSELMTHRVFSRNARSSRAVPVVTLLKEEPYTPHFMANQPGMQALEELSQDARLVAESIWLDLITKTRIAVNNLNALGVHKQWANRPLEWFGWIDVLVTSTDWANWFALRDHSDAMPEIAELARLMQEVFNASTPQDLYYGEWHLPYITTEEKQEVRDGLLQSSNAWDQLKILSAARCARLSYKPFDGNADYNKELDRYRKLVASAPVHASPTEHQATPDFMTETDLGKGQTIKVWGNPTKQGNFLGWCQARKDIANEAVFDDHYYSSYRGY